MSWVTDSNEALHLRLVRAEGEETHDGRTADFHPSFTYPIYGEDEKIFGYLDLYIALYFASGSLKQYFKVTSTKQPAAKADDVEGALYKFIPPDYTKDEKIFHQQVEKDADEFSPFGKLVHSYTRPSNNNKGKSVKHIPRDDDLIYEVYHSAWDTPGFRDYHRHMQIFIPLYIEGGSYIVEDEEKWEFVVLCADSHNAEGKERWHFVGYSSLYPFWCWPNNVRLRLSQFVILPPFQEKHHGFELYNTIYKLVRGSILTTELTVEDPSEGFEDMRDRCDLATLRANAEFMEGWQPKGGGEKGWRSPINRAWEKKWMSDLKLAKRQFQRLTEMLILDHLQPGDEEAERAFRLQVKERLYRFNYEILMQMDKPDRLDKLEDTFQGVREDYLRILAGKRREPPK
ncbi:acyl-CoA N-acyltransferase [Dacryopinax primogenitus]|uniref:Histone acetyltransferase type B catalytic subunit n=1 Tax=Dacryopinax primogenitus (strain DJM 731) TaxID=1858805 RepID=M5G695_DACPD|nr:acyl-CoA N-acyltransferase [Dacryopinax primogenitus]EJU05781.1 acyl-CoA N-acyltransferase [Dacryopinax primogenitus]